MKNKQSKYLVIDASIARSCGGEDAKHPTSKNCRDFLKAVLKICHSMVMTDELQAEWNKHESTFARKWRVSMIAKRKYKFCKSVTLSELRNKLEQLKMEHKTREAIWKNIPEVKLILWLNPDKESESVKWLEKGAILENKRLIGYREESS